MYLAFPVSSGRFTQAIHVSGYSGTIEERYLVFAYRTFTFYGSAFQHFPLTKYFVTFLCRFRQNSIVLLPHTCQRQVQFGLLPFRSPLLRECCYYCNLFSFPLGTEMFHFPKSTPRHLYNDAVLLSGVGFPIRTPPGHRLHVTLPKLIAD